MNIFTPTHLRYLGRQIEGSGLDQAWQEADIYSSITVTKLSNGNHHKRSVEVHQVTLQVCFDLLMQQFVKDHPAVHDSLNASAKELDEVCKTKQGVPKAHHAFLVTLESLNLEKQLQGYDASHNNDPRYKWLCMCMR